MKILLTQKRVVARIISFSFVFALFLYAGVSYAQYVPLVGLPQVAGTGQGLAAYFNQLYMVTIAIGAILAFIKISIAGVKWSLSDVVTDKGDAKKDINGALLGLAILLIPFIVLNTIYPGLTNLNILQNSNSVKINPTRPPGAAVVPTDPNVITPPGSVSVNQVVQNCFYTLLSSGTDMNGAPIYIGYDDSACRSQCASRSGSTFTSLSESAGRCSWYEGTACTTGINCPGDTGYVGA